MASSESASISFVRLSYGVKQNIFFLFRGFNNYKKCFGNSYSACVNVDYFVSRGIKTKDAYIYVALIYEFVYECSSAASKGKFILY